MVKQLSLFNRQSLNIARDFKECLATLVSESGLSRQEYLDQLNEVAARFGVRLMKGNGNGLTMATFEKWLNVDNLQYMPPLVAIPVICEVSGSVAPLQIIAKAIGMQVIDEPQIKKLMWADAIIEEREARKKKKRLEAEL